VDSEEVDLTQCHSQWEILKLLSIKEVLLKQAHTETMGIQPEMLSVVDPNSLTQITE
jgi:hypothetical protein